MATAVSSSEADKGDAEAKNPSNKKGKASKGGHGEEAEQLDPKLAEFLQVMQPRSKSRMWANDDLLPDGSDKSARNKPWEGAGGSISSKEQLQKAANRKAVKEALQFDDDDDDDDVDAVEDDNDENHGDDNDDDDSDSGNEVDDDDVKEEAKVSDLDFLKKKTVKGNFDDDESEESDESDAEDDEEEEGDDDDDEEEADGSDAEEMEEAEEAEVRPFSSCSLLPARKRTLVVCLGFAGVSSVCRSCA